MLSTLTDKVYSMQEQMSNISREIEILRKKQKEMLRIKNTVTEMKSAFEGHISRLHTAEERIPKLEDTSIESSQTEKAKKKMTKTSKKPKNQNEILKNCGTHYKRCDI